MLECLRIVVFSAPSLPILWVTLKIVAREKYRDKSPEIVIRLLDMHVAGAQAR